MKHPLLKDTAEVDRKGREKIACREEKELQREKKRKKQNIKAAQNQKEEILDKMIISANWHSIVNDNNEYKANIHIGR